MQAITSSMLEQIGQHIWTCRGTATSFTSECQEIIGECTEEVGWAWCNADQLWSHYISSSQFMDTEILFRQETNGKDGQTIMYTHSLLQKK